MPITPQSAVPTEEAPSQAARSLEELHSKILEMRNQKAPEYVPPPLPQGIITRTQLEMEEGKKRNEQAKAERDAALQRASEAAEAKRKKEAAIEGTTEPVYRPADYVPNMDQGQTPTRTYKSL